MKYKIAVLDDYQNVALESADWSVPSGRGDITVFRDHLRDKDGDDAGGIQANRLAAADLFGIVKPKESSRCHS